MQYHHCILVPGSTSNAHINCYGKLQELHAAKHLSVGTSVRLCDCYITTHNTCKADRMHSYNNYNQCTTGSMNIVYCSMHCHKLIKVAIADINYDAYSAFDLL